MRVPVWDLPFASESSSGIAGESGLNPSQGKAPNSYSLFRRDRISNPGRRAVVVAEDNIGDVFLVKEAVAAANLDVDLYFIDHGDEVLRFFTQINEGDVR